MMLEKWFIFLLYKEKATIGRIPLLYVLIDVDDYGMMRMDENDYWMLIVMG